MMPFTKKAMKNKLKDELNNAKTPLEAEKILEKICQTEYVNDNNFVFQLESACDFHQFHLVIDYNGYYSEPNIEVNQEVFWGQDADNGSLNTDGYTSGYVLGYGHVTQINENSIFIDNYGMVNKEDIEFQIFPGIRMLYMYLNADGIEIFKIDGTVINGSFIVGFTEEFPESIKQEIEKQLVKKP